MWCSSHRTKIKLKKAVLDSFYIESSRRSQSCLDGDAKGVLKSRVYEEFPNMCFTGLNPKSGVDRNQRVTLDAVLPQCLGSVIVTVVVSWL